MKRAKEITSKIMASIKSKDTRPELALRKKLWSLGFRYRKNYKILPGKPDIAFTKIKLAVFCDGDFWHGNNWKVRNLGCLENELSLYNGYWREKL